MRGAQTLPGSRPRQANCPDRLRALRKVATIESVGSSTRSRAQAFGSPQVQALLSNPQLTSCRNRDEQEVAGYAQTMDLVFEAGALALLGQHGKARATWHSL